MGKKKKKVKQSKEKAVGKELMAMVINLEGCARCGESHKDHLIKQFRNPSVALKDGVEIVHNFWSFCPTADEPNFFHIDVKIQENGGEIIEEGATKNG